MKKVLVISNNYPNENNKYSDVFVHERAKGYKGSFNIFVGGVNKELPLSYSYEGVTVRTFRDKRGLFDYIDELQPDIILIHFLKYWMVDPLIKRKHIPLIIWVHGYEVLKWYRRLFNFEFTKGFLKTIISSEIQSYYWRKLIKYSNLNNNRKVHFVFISNWMKTIAEIDCGIKPKYYSIIPNPIDMRLFKFKEKSIELRNKVLLIRSFNSRKYANDIAIKGIIEFSKYPEFEKFDFCIYGKGKFFYSLTKPLLKMPNVKVNNYFVEHKDIPSIHKNFGIFLCPTRQDAQGVSMCEAMASGLIPITSNNTAIPEFVKNFHTGFYADNPKMIAEHLITLFKNPILFLKISKNATEFISECCDKQKILESELQLINKLLLNNIS